MQTIRPVPASHCYPRLENVVCGEGVGDQEIILCLPSQVAMRWFSTGECHNIWSGYFWFMSVNNSSPSVSQSTKKNNTVSLLTLVLSTGQTFLGRFYSFQTMERSLPALWALLPRSRRAARLGLCPCCSWKAKLSIEKSRASILELQVPVCLRLEITQTWVLGVTLPCSAAVAYA